MFFKKDSKEKAPATPAAKPAQNAHTRAVPASLAGVTNIIAVASGKGGVGKSTVSSNLAVALKELGYSVGLLDADIYGPSQPGMLGAAGSKADITPEQKLVPMKRHGVDFVSMGLLMDDDTPVIWRAPIAMKMIMQFIGAVDWGKRDFLLIDLPPGTGDVQLTLAQQAALTGAVIVTTPQQVALGVARKGLRMFEQVNVPVIGIIENMSGFTCKHCGETTAVFKEGGGRDMAEQLNVPFLGAIPLDPDIMMSGDDGTPVVEQSKDSAATKSIMAVAEQLRDQMERMQDSVGVVEPLDFAVQENGELFVKWSDGHEGRHTPYHLRLHCTCANCIDEDTGKRLLDPAKVPLDIGIDDIKPVGRYGFSITFSDRHSTGIYTYKHLRSLCECDACIPEGKDKPQSFSV